MDRFCAADRRAGSRAGAGHHHRRGLPLLFHAGAQIHRRRCAGARAIHAQHGHGRIDGGRRRHPDRSVKLNFI